MKDTSVAKRILNYLDIEETERRVNKIMEFFDEYKHLEIEAAKVSIKEMYEVNGRVERRLKMTDMFIPKENTGYKPIASPKNSEILNHVTEYVCNRYGISVDQLKANSPKSCYDKIKARPGRKMGKGSRYYVNARTEFAKIIRSHYYNRITIATVAEFMGYGHHSSVIHLYKDRKSYDEIPEAV